MHHWHRPSSVRPAQISPRPFHSTSPPSREPSLSSFFSFPFSSFSRPRLLFLSHSLLYYPPLSHLISSPLSGAVGRQSHSDVRASPVRHWKTDVTDSTSLNPPSASKGVERSCNNRGIFAVHGAESPPEAPLTRLNSPTTPLPLVTPSHPRVGQTTPARAHPPV